MAKFVHIFQINLFSLLHEPLMLMAKIRCWIAKLPWCWRKDNSMYKTIINFLWSLIWTPIWLVSTDIMFTELHNTAADKNNANVSTTPNFSVVKPWTLWINSSDQIWVVVVCQHQRYIPVYGQPMKVASTLNLDQQSIIAGVQCILFRPTLDWLSVLSVEFGGPNPTGWTESQSRPIP